MDIDVVAVDDTVDVAVVNSHALNRLLSTCWTRLFNTATSLESHLTLIKPNGSWHLNVAAAGTGFNPFLRNSDIMEFKSSTLFAQFESVTSCTLLTVLSMQPNVSVPDEESPNTSFPSHSCRAFVNDAVESSHFSSLFT